MLSISVFVLFAVPLCYCQDVVQPGSHNGLTESIGNFSIQLLYHTSRNQQNGQNLIMSPITVWSGLAVMSEGSVGNTRDEIDHAMRLPSRDKSLIRSLFLNIAQWLQVNTTTVEVGKINAIFVDRQIYLFQDLRDIAKNYYDAEMVSLDFADKDNSANLFNGVISDFTHGRLSEIVESSYFENSQMFLTSAVYFRGQWTMPFNASSTVKQPFHDSKGRRIGEVNMMHNCDIYPIANIVELQALVVELPYGKENRLSMVIMLPDPGVSLERMFSNFGQITLDRFFEELRLSKENYGDDEVDCYIPRFKIESNLDVTEVLRNAMGIRDLFDQTKSTLPYAAREELFVSKVTHKAEIEVIEDGITASERTVAEFSNLIGGFRFEANRPFTYMIIEKVTNTIVLGGFYQQPSLY